MATANLGDDDSIQTRLIPGKQTYNKWEWYRWATTYCSTGICPCKYFFYFLQPIRC